MIESVICSDTNVLEGGHIKQIGFQGMVNECPRNQNKEAKAWKHGTN
jgi:hypothetical protein